MKRSTRAAGAAVLLTALATGCRHMEVATPLPADWGSLIAPPVAFAALYRLDCCRLTNLLATIRSDGSHLRVSVAAPPGGTVLDAWLTTGNGWLTRNGGRCTQTLPPDTLPLAEGRLLPLDVGTAAFVLSGRLPAGAAPRPGEPGWVSVGRGPVELAWRVGGSPPRCTAFEMRRAATGELLIRGELADHHGRVPGTLRFEIGSEDIGLELAEWQPGVEPVQPPWTGAPSCGASP
ncbi:MAG: hypothetical protein ACM3O7_03845 [Acidobacteriota bacterium]